MAEPDLLFRNRMGPRNWAFMAAGFILALPLLLAEGVAPSLAVAICAGLALAAMAIAALVITLMGRSQVAELTREGDMLTLEMLAPLGRGRRFSLPVSAARDWRVDKRSIRFRHAEKEFSLPLHGARIDWPGLRTVAPALEGGPK